MAKKNICIIPGTWTLKDYELHSCSDGSHRHASRAEIRTEIQAERTIPLRKDVPGKNDVYYILPSTNPGPSLSRYCSADPLNSGLSYKVGETLATAIRKGQPWALVMFDHICGRRETAPTVASI